MRANVRQKILKNLSLIKQETNDSFIRNLAHSSYRMLNKPSYFEEAIYHMASNRLESIDDYIMLAKQAIAHAEKDRDED